MIYKCRNVAAEPTEQWCVQGHPWLIDITAQYCQLQLISLPYVMQMISLPHVMQHWVVLEVELSMFTITVQCHQLQIICLSHVMQCIGRSVFLGHHLVIYCYISICMHFIANICRSFSSLSLICSYFCW